MDCLIPGILPVTVIVYWPADEVEPPEDGRLPELELTPQPTGISRIKTAQKASKDQRLRRRARKPMGSNKARAIPEVFQNEGAACAV